MTKQSKSDRYLTQLKLALTAGGLIATFIGAGLLGREAATLTNQTSAVSGLEPAITTHVDSTVQIDADIPEALDLDLEAIPTVVAPTMRTAPVARGHSSA